MDLKFYVRKKENRGGESLTRGGEGSKGKERGVAGGGEEEPT